MTFTPPGFEPWPDTFEPATLRVVRDEPPLPRCRCSHGPSTHTGGHGRCWISVCCCETYADPQEIADAKDRHPSGKTVDRPRYPANDGGPSISEYLESKGER